LALDTVLNSKVSHNLKDKSEDTELKLNTKANLKDNSADMEHSSRANHNPRDSLVKDHFLVTNIKDQPLSMLDQSGLNTHPAHNQVLVKDLVNIRVKVRSK